MGLTLKSAATLINKEKMPLLGLGTWKLAEGKEAEQAVQWALEAGYRHIDTAAIYGNETSVGNAIKKSGITREQIFLTTKLWNDHHTFAEKAFSESLKKLGTGYVDLYLIHWPVSATRNKAWKVLEKLNKEGICRSIGVSNFTIAHLEELFKTAEIIPAVNQVEFHPWLNQKELLDFCKRHKIQLEAYSPLARTEKFSDPVLAEISRLYEKTPAQILIRWCLQKNIVTIPKSKSKARIVENAAVYDFELKDADMKKLDSLNQNYRTCWNPEEIQ